MNRPSEKTLETIRVAVERATSENRPLSLLFVCLGNICRSPAAQGIFEQLAARDNLTDVTADSCGFYGGHAGDLPDHRMRQAAWQRGYRLDHRSRTIRPYDFENFDLIFGMDLRNLQDLRHAARTLEEEARILPMIDLATDFPQFDSVPDPYWSGASGFHTVLDLLENACAELIRLIKEFHLQHS